MCWKLDCKTCCSLASVEVWRLEYAELSCCSCVHWRICLQCLLVFRMMSAHIQKYWPMRAQLSVLMSQVGSNLRLSQLHPLRPSDTDQSQGSIFGDRTTESQNHRTTESHRAESLNHRIAVCRITKSQNHRIREPENHKIMKITKPHNGRTTK